jgi:hypothetical protein
VARAVAASAASVRHGCRRTARWSILQPTGSKGQAPNCTTVRGRWPPSRRRHHSHRQGTEGLVSAHRLSWGPYLTDAALKCSIRGVARSVILSLRRISPADGIVWEILRLRSQARSAQDDRGCTYCSKICTSPCSREAVPIRRVAADYSARSTRVRNSSRTRLKRAGSSAWARCELSSKSTHSEPRMPRWIVSEIAGVASS